MCASSSPADPTSPSTSPRSSSRSRRNSAAKAGVSRTSPRRASRTWTRPGPPRSDSNGPSARNLGSRADDMDLRAWRRRIRDYDEITNVGPIIRRYFVIGAFDGALTVLGIIIGAYAVGAYEAERVEKKLDIRTIERAMLARLSEEHKEAFQFAAILSALVHGIAPLLAALLPIIPFAFLNFRDATIAAIVITFVVLFVIGAYLGNLVRERVIVTGLRFVAAGLGTAVLLWLMGARPLSGAPPFSRWLT